MSVARELLERVGAAERIVRELADGRVRARCPLPGHRDRHASAVVFSFNNNSASGVLLCEVCGKRSPFQWLTECGLSPAETMELLGELGVRDEERPKWQERAARRTDTPGRVQHRPRAAAPRPRVVVPDPLPRVELPALLMDRLAQAVVARRRFDARLAELRGFASDVLDLAGVGVGYPHEFGFLDPVGNGALHELRLLVPVRERGGRAVGLLAVAPNPERRADPKVLARHGSARTGLLLELWMIPNPITNLVLVCEGELDAITAASCAIPSVGAHDRADAPRIAEIVRERAFDYALLIPDADRAGRRAFGELAAALTTADVAAKYADVLPYGADVGSELVRLTAALAHEQPQLTDEERRREAGRLLLTLAASASTLEVNSQPGRTTT